MFLFLFFPLFRQVIWIGRTILNQCCGAELFLGRLRLQDFKLNFKWRYFGTYRTLKNSKLFFKKQVKKILGALPVPVLAFFKSSSPFLRFNLFKIKSQILLSKILIYEEWREMVFLPWWDFCNFIIKNCFPPLWWCRHVWIGGLCSPPRSDTGSSEKREN